MVRMKGTIFVLLVIAHTALYAEDGEVRLPQLSQPDQQIGGLEWREVGGQMSLEEYNEASHYNQRLVGRAVRDYVEGKFLLLGVPDEALELTGAAIGFAVQGGTFKLNDKMALEVEDVLDGDPVIFYKMKFDW